MNKSSKKTNMTLMYRIIGIAVLCVSLVMVSYNVTLAWFMDESVTSNSPNVLLIGTVDLEVNTNFDFYNLALAPDTYYTSGVIDGENVSYATTIKTTTKNDVRDIYVRAKFITSLPQLSIYFDGNLLQSDETYDSSAVGNWYYNEAKDTNGDGTTDTGDGYYYYIGSVDTTAITFNAGYHVNNSISNEIAKDQVTIDFIFESIQKPYGAYIAEWPNAPQIFKDFAAADSGVSSLD